MWSVSYSAVGGRKHQPRRDGVLFTDTRTGGKHRPRRAIFTEHPQGRKL